MTRLFALLDARDVFVAIGFACLYAGVALKYGNPVALIVVGAIVLLKGLTRWV